MIVVLLFFSQLFVLIVCNIFIYICRRCYLSDNIIEIEKFC